MSIVGPGSAKMLKEVAGSQQVSTEVSGTTCRLTVGCVLKDLTEPEPRGMSWNLQVLGL